VFDVALTTRQLNDPGNKFVTSLTFQGHMTSSVTWPFDTP